MSITEEIRAKLDALGDNSDQVAELLTALGIKGRGMAGDDCPLYHYLKRDFPAVRSVDYGDVAIADPRAEDGFDSVPLPRACADFAYRFDIGRYPQLQAGRR